MSLVLNSFSIGGFVSYWQVRRTIAQKVRGLAGKIPTLESEHSWWLDTHFTLFKNMHHRNDIAKTINSQIDTHLEKHFYDPTKSFNYTVLMLSNAIFTIFGYKLRLLDCFCGKHRGTKLVHNNKEGREHVNNCYCCIKFVSTMKEYHNKQDSIYWKKTSKDNADLTKCVFYHSKIKNKFCFYMSLILKAGDAHNIHKPAARKDEKSFASFLDDEIDSFKCVGKEFCIILMMMFKGKINPDTSNEKYEQIINNPKNIKEGEAFLNECLKASGQVLDFHPIYENLLRLVISTGPPKATIAINSPKIEFKIKQIIENNWQKMQHSEKGGILIAPSNDGDTKQDSDNQDSDSGNNDNFKTVQSV